MKLNIPSYGEYEIKNLIFDYNGTIAKKGQVIEGLKEVIVALCQDFNVFIVTADTYGSVRENFKDTPVKIKIISGDHEADLKLKALFEIGPENSISFGNGRNDVHMLKQSAIGIGIIGSEGMASSLVQSADILVKSIFDAVDLVNNKNSLIATLRR
ncbi:MAG: HAD hydrolase family protein [Firmicutes bacterium]|jgi:soluble P-type ATPase|nr:HAD hydrolase family protein [Bacillota bacterium]